MKKKLLCLTLSLMMLLSCVLVSCSNAGKNGEDDGGGDEVDNSAKTIVMWVVTEEETDEKAMELVNDAFTKITKAKFKTNVVIKFCTEDEYYDKLEAAIEAQQYDIEMQEKHDKALRQYLRLHKGEKDPAELTKDFYVEYPEYVKYAQVEEPEDDEDATESEEETFVNDYGIIEIKYPEPKENQVDIFYLSGYDKYMEYYNAEWLASLSEELSTSSKKLNDYISTSLLNGVQIEGGVYAIPNNVEIGEYTYMMIDKEKFDMYYQKIDKVNSVLDLNTFLNDIANDNQAKGLTPDDAGYIVPLASNFSECARMLCWYWDLSYTDQSVYNMQFDEDTGRYYVLKKQYEVKTETIDENGEVKVNTTVVVADSVEDNCLYKTNAQGQFVDKNGNALNYSYKVDEKGGLVVNEKTNKVAYDAAGKGALYLVDENGDAVTPDTDLRVKIDAETKTDADGNTRPTYYYAYKNDSDFSILGTMMKDASLRSRGEINLSFNSLFTDAEYRNLYATLMDYEYKGFYGDVKEGQTAAVSFVKGNAQIKMDYAENGVYVDKDGKEYYVVIAEYPEATEAELYGNMFAVYANSNYLSRSMEVITYLNTNKEMRDLLQYGIKDQHYELVEDENKKGVTARPISQNEYGIYRMDIEKTGNCFIATPPESMGVDAWTYAKSQNNDSLINPLLGFDFNAMTADSDYSLDVALIDHIAKLNADALDMIRECADKNELVDLMNDADEGFLFLFSAKANDVKLNKAINPEYDPEMPDGEGGENTTPDKSGSSPCTVYFSWLDNYGYLVEEDD